MHFKSSVITYGKWPARTPPPTYGIFHMFRSFFFLKASLTKAVLKVGPAILREWHNRNSYHGVTYIPGIAANYMYELYVLLIFFKCSISVYSYTKFIIQQLIGYFPLKCIISMKVLPRGLNRSALGPWKSNNQVGHLLVFERKWWKWRICQTAKVWNSKMGLKSIFWNPRYI